MIRFNEERLKEMSFVDFLEYMYNLVDHLDHRAKSDSIYQDVRDISRRIIHRYVNETKTGWDDYYKHHDTANNIKIDREILDKYKFSDSDKGKKYIIDEFRRDMLTDLRTLIIEQGKLNPDKTETLE